MVKNPLVTQETWVQSLDLEDSFEKEIAIHFSISCLENPMGREPSGL